MLTRNGKIYLGTILALSVILTIIMIMSMVVTASADPKLEDGPAVERIENIEGTKSELFYCNETGTYLIYSRKGGTWYELRGDDDGYEELPIYIDDSGQSSSGKTVSNN